MRSLLGRRRAILVGALACALVAAPNTAPAQEPFPGLDAYVTKAMQTWKVPGIAIAIVRHDSVLYTKGFGVLATGGTTPVNDQTLFEIGSSSKAFTATLVAMLVSDGKMRYDAHLTDYLPDFRMYDPVANAEVTLRDALSHRSGIARGELVWLGSGLSRDEVLHRVRFLKPEAPFRSHYSYQNMMFLAAGQAAAKTAGSTWEDLVKQRIFEPLGMTSSVASYRSAGPNTAKPHGMVKDSVFSEPFMNTDNIAPAGAVLSNARDMAQWLRFQLSDGVFNGKRLVAAAALRETHTPQILMTGAPEGGMRALSDSIPVTHFSTYGMGWIIEDYRNHLMWQHGGNTIGSTAAVGMLPEEKFGVVVLSNMAGAQLPAILMHYIFDRQIGAPMRDLSAESYARVIAQRRRADSAEVAQTGASTRRGAPPVELTAFAGGYADSLYGDATVTVENDRLVLKRGEWQGPLEFVNALNFTWKLPGVSPLPSMPIRFEVAPDGKVTGMYFGLGNDATLLSRKAVSGGRGGRRGGPPGGGSTR
jgi:CubicO group peptidase (beta-lactamase class C family)